LPCLIARRCKTEAIDHVVNSTFERQKQILACNTLFPIRLGEIVGELVLKDPINTLYLLFLAQLNSIANCLRAMIAAVLSWRKVALFNGACIPEAAVSLEEELNAFPPAKPTFRFAVSSQNVTPFLINPSNQ
jgi:hypothetical protein